MLDNQPIVKDPNKYLILDYYKKRGRLVHLGIPVDEVWRRMQRTDQNTICEECGKKHREHPFIDDVLDDVDFRPAPFLHLLCDGRLAKL